MELNAVLLFSPAIFYLLPPFCLSDKTTVEWISRLRFRMKHLATEMCFLRLVHWITAPTPTQSDCGLHRQVESTGIQEGGTSGISHLVVLVLGAMLCSWLRMAHPVICKGTRHVHAKGPLPLTARVLSGLPLTPVTLPGVQSRMENTCSCRSSGASMLLSPWCLDSSSHSAENMHVIKNTA